MSTTIIAEACQNHKGDLSILSEMIYAAKEAGADYIKIQSMLAEELTHRERFERGITENGEARSIQRPFAAEYERLKPMNLDDGAHAWFVAECKKAGIKPLTTAFTLSRIDFLATLDWDAIKVASYDCASLPMIEKLKENFRHLFLSTGATFDEEIRETANLLKGHSFNFLHCVTIYPTPLHEVHLRRMDWLRQFCKEVGFSDHSMVRRDGLKASFAALYYGADIIERHFTVLDSKETKDGPVSIGPEALKELVDFSRLEKREQKKYIDENIPEYSRMLGHETRTLSREELLNRDYYRGRFASQGEGKIQYNWIQS